MKYLYLFFIVLGLFFAAESSQAAGEPYGFIDNVTDSGVVRGWAVDPDLGNISLEVHAYFDGPAGQSSIVKGAISNVPRCDVGYIYPTCALNGFEIPIPNSLRDGKAHKVYVYALGIGPDLKQSSERTLLRNSGKSFVFPVMSTTRHPKGSVVSNNGTVYYLGESLRYAFPNPDIFFSWGHTFDKVVKANSADLAMPIGPVVNYK